MNSIAGVIVPYKLYLNVKLVYIRKIETGSFTIIVPLWKLIVGVPVAAQHNIRERKLGSLTLDKSMTELK
jgi:hypothetical protein